MKDQSNLIDYSKGMKVMLIKCLPRWEIKIITRNSNMKEEEEKNHWWRQLKTKDLRINLKKFKNKLDWFHLRKSIDCYKDLIRTLLRFFRRLSIVKKRDYSNNNNMNLKLNMKANWNNWKRRVTTNRNKIWELYQKMMVMLKKQLNG